jgi:flagellar motor switch/type III secretory pathway protein FliN
MVPFRLKFNSQHDEIHVALTAGVVDSISQSAQKESHSKGREVNNELVHCLHRWPAMVSVELGKCTVTVDELMKLAPGSVLRLDTSPHEPVDVLINSVSKLRGQPVVSHNSVAIRLEGWRENEQRKDRCQRTSK